MCWLKIGPGLKNTLFAWLFYNLFPLCLFSTSKSISQDLTSSGPSKRIAFFISHLAMRFLKNHMWGNKQTIDTPPPLFSFALMKNTGGKRILNMFIMDMEITSDHCQIDILKISFIFLKIGQSLLNICSSGSQSPWGFSSDLSNQTLPSPTSELGGLFFWVFVSENEEKLGRERKRSGSKPEVINL